MIANIEWLMLGTSFVTLAALIYSAVKENPYTPTIAIAYLFSMLIAFGM